jgi:hypothetical protein
MSSDRLDDLLKYGDKPDLEEYEELSDLIDKVINFFFKTIFLFYKKKLFLKLKIKG